MKNRVFYIILAVVIAVGAVYSYMRLDFGGKTAIFFKIAFGDENSLTRTPRKKPPQGEISDRMSTQGGHEERGIKGERRGNGPPQGKGKRGKPGTGGIISLRNVIPYSFILAFFILITRFVDVSLRKALKRRSST